MTVLLTWLGDSLPGPTFLVHLVEKLIMNFILIIITMKLIITNVRKFSRRAVTGFVIHVSSQSIYDIILLVCLLVNDSYMLDCLSLLPLVVFVFQSYPHASSNDYYCIVN